MKTSTWIAAAIGLICTNVFAAEVCTLFFINGRVTIGCSNTNNGTPISSNENLTTALKTKLDAGFELAGQTSDIGGPQNNQLAIVYTLIKK